MKPIYILSFLIGVFITSCLTPLEKVNKVFNKYPIEALTVATERYPSKDSVREIIKFLPGIPILTPGPLINCDSLKPSPTGLKTFQCPPSTKIVDTFTKDRVEIKYDTRLISLLQKQLEVEEMRTRNFEREVAVLKDRLKKSNGNNLKLLALVGIMTLIIGFLVFLLFKK